MSFTTRALRYMSSDQEDTTLYSSLHDDLHVFELSTVRIVVPIQKHCERKRERDPYIKTRSVLTAPVLSS